MRNRILISAVVIGFFLTLIVVSNAKADVYVKVDANGNAIGGAIVCDAGTCGAGSLFSQLTLQAGEQYVLQATGQAGIGNNNPNTQVKVDIATNDWTVTRQVEVKPVEPVVINDQKVISYTVEVKETFNPKTNPPSWQPALESNSTTFPPIQSNTETTLSAGSVAFNETATALLTVEPTIDYISILKEKTNKLIMMSKKLSAKVKKVVKK